MAIHHSQEPLLQQVLFQQANNHWAPVNSRRPTKLAPKQGEALNDGPQYQRLTQ